MPAFEVHCEVLARRYVAPCCSPACLANVVLIGLTAILPLWAARATGGHWTGEVLRWEQPRVSMGDTVAVTLTGVRGPGGSEPFRHSWTTSSAANALLSAAGELRTGVVRASATDADDDGHADELRVSVALSLTGDEVVLGAALAATLRVRLASAARLDMDAVAAIAGSGGGGGTAFEVDGDVEFVQRAPLPAPRGSAVWTPYARAPLPALDSAVSMPPGGWPAALADAARARDVTVRVAVPFPAAWPPELAPPAALPAAAAVALQPRTFVVALRLRVPPAALRVRAGAGEVFAWVLVRYIAFLAPTLALVWAARALLFAHHLLNTVVFIDAPRGKMHAE